MVWRAIGFVLGGVTGAAMAGMAYYAAAALLAAALVRAYPPIGELGIPQGPVLIFGGVALIGFPIAVVVGFVAGASVGDQVSSTLHRIGRRC